MTGTKYSLDTILMWKHIPKAGELLLLSGTIYTARDAAHKLLLRDLESNSPLPFPLEASAIYYCGPTPSRGITIGSCGPTTSYRMDPYTPTLLSHGVACTIGKGDRGNEVYDAIIEHNAIYLAAIGGCGALYAECVLSSEEIAYPELGCESIKRLTIRDFPVYVAIDSRGKSIYRK